MDVSSWLTPEWYARTQSTTSAALWLLASALMRCMNSSGALCPTILRTWAGGHVNKRLDSSQAWSDRMQACEDQLASPFSVHSRPDGLPTTGRQTSRWGEQSCSLIAAVCMLQRRLTWSNTSTAQRYTITMLIAMAPAHSLSDLATSAGPYGAACQADMCSHASRPGPCIMHSTTAHRTGKLARPACAHASRPRTCIMRSSGHSTAARRTVELARPACTHASRPGSCIMHSCWRHSCPQISEACQASMCSCKQALTMPHAQQRTRHSCPQISKACQAGMHSCKHALTMHHAQQCRHDTAARRTVKPARPACAHVSRPRTCIMRSSGHSTAARRTVKLARQHALMQADPPMQGIGHSFGHRPSHATENNVVDKEIYLQDPATRPACTFLSGSSCCGTADLAPTGVPLTRELLLPP